MSNEKRSRVTVSMQDFVRVVVNERGQFDTIEKAASELGMTVGSFKQRLTRERKNYPAVFGKVGRYGRTTQRLSEAEVLAMVSTGQNESEANG